MENSQLIDISFLRGYNTPQPSKGAIVFYYTGISTLDFSLKTQSSAGTVHHEICQWLWRQMAIQMSACRLGLSDRLVGGNQSKAEDYSSSHQSPACSQFASQSAQASGPRIHQRGHGLTSRKMSSTFYTSGQIVSQCHRLSTHERSSFKRDKRDRKCVSIQYLPLVLFKF